MTLLIFIGLGQLNSTFTLGEELASEEEAEENNEVRMLLWAMAKSYKYNVRYSGN